MDSHTPYMPTVEATRLGRAERMTLRTDPVTATGDGYSFAVRAYTVTFHLHGPSCTCPDGRMRRHFVCKHVMFVLLAFLGVAKPTVSTLTCADVRAAIETQALE